jgi:cob(I)alamin adenosyltransferase
MLDEILDAVEFGFLSETDITHLMKQKPEKTHLILTGHKKFPKILAAADLVTRMTKEKHPYDRGFLAIRGIDY